MKTTALELAFKMVQLSEEISELCIKKEEAKGQKEDAALDTRINAKEREFHDIKDILGKINI